MIKKPWGMCARKSCPAWAVIRRATSGPTAALGAAEEIAEDVRSIVIAPQVEAKIAKRSKGILSREIKKTGEGAGR